MKKSLFLIILLISLKAHSDELLTIKQAKNIGFKTCIGTVEKGSYFISNDLFNQSLATYASGNPDDRIFNVAVGIKYDSGDQSYSILNVAQTKSGVCDGNLVTVFYFKETCPTLRESLFKSWMYKTSLADLEVLTTVEHNNITKTLMPAGSGCVVISSDIL